MGYTKVSRKLAYYNVELRGHQSDNLEILKQQLTNRDSGVFTPPETIPASDVVALENSYPVDAKKSIVVVDSEVKNGLTRTLDSGVNAILELMKEPEFRNASEKALKENKLLLFFDKDDQPRVFFPEDLEIARHKPLIVFPEDVHSNRLEEITPTEMYQINQNLDNLKNASYLLALPVIVYSKKKFQRYRQLGDLLKTTKEQGVKKEFQITRRKFLALASFGAMGISGGHLISSAFREPVRVITNSNDKTPPPPGNLLSDAIEPPGEIGGFRELARRGVSFGERKVTIHEHRNAVVASKLIKLEKFLNAKLGKKPTVAVIFGTRHASIVENLIDEERRQAGIKLGIQKGVLLPHTLNRAFYAEYDPQENRYKLKVQNLAPSATQ